MTVDATGLEIAVIGMAGRFPKARSVDELWSNLLAGTECISFFSDDEVRRAGIDPALLADPHYVRAGGIVDDVEMFDAQFFGYSPREAALIDPQQRLFLETAWTALEHAGYAPGTINGAVGVYGGVGVNDYLSEHVRPAATRTPPEFVHLATDRDFLTTRVSYKLNLDGPSVAVQTACSTSLVAIHLACQGLLAGECDVALAGGVTIRLPQTGGYLYQDGGISSPDGHCRAFSDRAQGCVAGNGGAIVVLKRLSDALADRDCIHAVIKGSTINNDGSLKVGYTAPSIEGQARVIRSALRVADVSAASIGYLEAHGTGTTLGDPIEIQAATQAFREDTDRKQYCGVGSIKTNLGHLDAGAGVAGFIKAVLAVKHGIVPPTLHCDATNPHVDFENSPFYVNATLRDWRTDSAPRRACVSAFGIGGTNAHVVVEEPPPTLPTPKPGARELLIVSAKSQRALESSCANLANFLRAHRDVNLPDVAFTLRRGRASLPHRRALVCADVEDAIASLGNHWGERKRSSTPHLIFMFPGQGSQYASMGRDLYDRYAVFRRYVDAAAEILTPHLGFDVRTLITGQATDAAHDRLRDTTVAQPAIFTVSYALAQLVADWGLRPAAMIGHSVGEYVAASVANVLSFEDALSLVCARGRLMAAIPPGSMVAVPLGADALGRLLPPTLALAAINAPGLSVVSGPVEATSAFVRDLQQRGVDVRPLHTSHAFHSQAMDPILDAFTAQFTGITLNEPTIPFVSNVTGTWMTAADATDPHYWARHLRSTVRFSEGLQTILETSESVLLELGPGQTLTTLARRHVREGHARPLAFATTRRAEDRDEDDVILDSLGGVWAAGVDVDWRRVDTSPGARRIPLPTYPFEHERFWLERASKVDAPDTKRRRDLSEWFSVPSWQRLPDRTAAGRGLGAGDDRSGRQALTVVFVDSYGVGEELAERLRARGDQVVIVRAGSAYSQSGDRAFQVTPAAPKHYQDLCVALGRLGQGKLHIVHCWMAEPDAAVRRGRADLDDYQDRGFYSLLLLAQALGSQRWIESSRVTVVSSNVHEVVGGETLCPEKATIAGPIKTIPLEYDAIECAQVDVVIPAAGASRATLLDLLCDTLDRPAGDLVAIRGGHRWRPCVIPERLNRADAPPLLKERGVYLITGGLGGVGLAVAEHLARTVRARLVLVGREAAPPRSEWAVGFGDASADSIVASAIAHASRVEPDIVKRVGRAGPTPMSRVPGLDRALDDLSAAYVREFLAQHGVDSGTVQVFDRRALQTQCRVVERFTRLFDRMLEMLERDGIVVLDGPAVRFTGSPASSSLVGLRRDAMSRYPEMTPLFDLLDHCAGHYHLALSGDVPALGLLFGDDNVDRFKRATDNIRAHSYVPLCEQIVRELLSTVAAGMHNRPLRILEVGGGDGILTRALLPAFAGSELEYTFTDISRTFVANARRQFAGERQGSMRFGVLDITKSPGEQRFAPGSFDAVVAFNVLHATRSVAESLSHASELLAPGGILVLQESVRPARWVDLIWGLTDGWWAYADTTLRRGSPLLDLDAWTRVVRDAGFDLVTSFPQSKDARSSADTGVIVGRKPWVVDRAAAFASACAKDDRSLARQHRMAALSRLDALGAEVETIAADVADPAAMRAAIDRAVRRFGGVDGVIHAALVLNDGAAQTKTRDGAAAVLAPKVAGTLVLEEVCRGLDLDFFVMFSSLVSMLGGRGQIDYCAASNFQDAFARAEQGKLARSVVSIDWAAWREVGKAFRAAVERGAAPDEAVADGMSPAEGVDAFMRILAAPHPQVLVSPVDIESLIEDRRRPRSATASARVEPQKVEDRAPVGDEAAECVSPRTETERVIARIWQQILGVPRLGVQDNFFDLGGDSMISLQFVAEAKKAGLRFTNRQVFEHQTIAELAAAATAQE